METSRRQFLKQTCGVCAALMGVSVTLPLMQGCSPLMTMKMNVSKGPIAVPLSHFTPENKVVILANEALEFDIAVVQLNNGQYKALELQCTHQSNALIPTKTGFFCNSHGSSFSFDGKVQKPPAVQNLKEFPIEQTKETVIVTI